MSDPERTHDNGETLLGSLQRIAELRDVFIVAIFVVYFIGLLTWSINSFLNRTGFVSLLDVRYWIAGFVPASMVFCCAFGYYSIAMPRRIVSGTRAFFNVLVMISILLVCLQVYVRWKILQASKLATFPWRGELWASALLILVFLIVFFVGNRLKTPSILVITNDEMRQRRPDRAKTLRTAFSVMGFASILAYIAFIFPNIPQELGGGAPRCADIELPTNTLSPKLISEMGGINLMPTPYDSPMEPPAGTTKGARNNDIIRIENFQVLHNSSDAIVGKFEKPPERREGFSVVHLEIARSSVRIIAWKEEVCENRSVLTSSRRPVRPDGGDTGS